MRNDINPKVEQIVIDSKPTEKAVVDAVSLSLYQLLQIKFLDSTRVKSVFPDDIVEYVIDAIERHLDEGTMVARSAIVSIVEEKFKQERKKLNRQQKSILHAISLRMDILYCRMNSGNCLILEFHPSYEPHGTYQMKYFLQYCNKIANRKDKCNLTLEEVEKILSCDKRELTAFRESYLSCVSDAYELKRLNSTKGAFEISMDSNSVKEHAENDFKSIREILEGIR